MVKGADSEGMGRDHTQPKNAGFWTVLLCLAGASAVVVLGLAVAFNLTLALVAACLLIVPLCWFAAVRFSLSRGQARAVVKEMDSNYEAIISMLTGALGLHDNMTLAHSTRVSQLSAVVAWELRLQKDQIRLIEKAAILHDIGKIGIAEDVIGKTGSLSEQDWSEMMRHPQLGFQILSTIGSLEDCAEIVYAHHERFDGQGYPRGLRGEEIPIGARIFAVVDAYVAMTSGRPYRKTLSHSMAVKEIVRNSLTQFDPEVVEAFLEADRQGLVDLTGATASVPEMYGDPVATEA
jgi:putative nucleotidyltransferase with HDIG domain